MTCLSVYNVGSICLKVSLWPDIFFYCVYEGKTLSNLQCGTALLVLNVIFITWGRFVKCSFHYSVSNCVGSTKFYQAYSSTISLNAYFTSFGPSSCRTKEAIRKCVSVLRTKWKSLNIFPIDNPLPLKDMSSLSVNSWWVTSVLVGQLAESLFALLNFSRSNINLILAKKWSQFVNPIMYQLNLFTRNFYVTGSL